MPSGCRHNAASNATLDATLDAASDASSRGDGAKKLSRGARARTKRAAAKSKTSRDGDGDGEFHDGPRDYRPYGDSWDGAGDLDVRRRVDSRRSVPVPVPDATRDPAPVVVWFRQDLRATDNPALHAAASSGAPVVPVFVWAPEEDGAWPVGGASRVWLHHALACLSDRLRERYGVDLTLRVADAITSGSRVGVTRRRARVRGVARVLQQGVRAVEDDARRGRGASRRGGRGAVPVVQRVSVVRTVGRETGRGRRRVSSLGVRLGSILPPRVRASGGTAAAAPRAARDSRAARRPPTRLRRARVARVGDAPDQKGAARGLVRGDSSVTRRFGERGASAALEAFLDDGLTRFDRKNQPRAG